MSFIGSKYVQGLLLLGIATALPNCAKKNTENKESAPAAGKQDVAAETQFDDSLGAPDFKVVGIWKPNGTQNNIEKLAKAIVQVTGFQIQIDKEGEKKGTFIFERECGSSKAQLAVNMKINRGQIQIEEGSTKKSKAQNSVENCDIQIKKNLLLHYKLVNDNVLEITLADKSALRSFHRELGPQEKPAKKESNTVEKSGALFKDIELGIIASETDKKLLANWKRIQSAADKSRNILSLIINEKGQLGLFYTCLTVQNNQIVSAIQAQSSQAVKISAKQIELGSEIRLSQVVGAASCQFTLAKGLYKYEIQNDKLFLTLGEQKLEFEKSSSQDGLDDSERAQLIPKSKRSLTEIDPNRTEPAEQPRPVAKLQRHSSEVSEDGRTRVDPSLESGPGKNELSTSMALFNFLQGNWTTPLDTPVVADSSIFNSFKVWRWDTWSFEVKAGVLYASRSANCQAFDGQKLTKSMNLHTDKIKLDVSLEIRNPKVSVYRLKASEGNFVLKANQEITMGHCEILISRSGNYILSVSTENDRQQISIRSPTNMSSAIFTKDGAP